MLLLIGARNIDGILRTSTVKITIAGNKFEKEGKHAVVWKDVLEIFSTHYFNIP